MRFYYNQLQLNMKIIINKLHCQAAAVYQLKDGNENRGIRLFHNTVMMLCPSPLPPHGGARGEGGEDEVVDCFAKRVGCHYSIMADYVLLIDSMLINVFGML